MIDSSRSPRPLWKRMATFLVLVVMILVALWTIWVKELHHSDGRIHALVRREAISLSHTVEPLPFSNG